MRYLTQCSFIALALAWVSPAAAGDLEFHGYMRAGGGLAAKGGPGVCYGIGESKFRLGNECDYVVEFIFNQHVAKLEDGSDWGLGIMPAGGGTWNGGNGGLSLGLNQAYVYGANVPQLAQGMVWAGRKYTARLQTGINDQFHQNASSTWYGEDGNGGEGVGVEDMKLGSAKLSLALIIDPVFTAPAMVDPDPTDDDDTQVPNPNGVVKPFKLTAYGSVPTVEKGELSFYALMVNRSKAPNALLGEDAPDPVVGSNQYNLALYHKLGGVLNGDLFVGGKFITSATLQKYRVLVQQGMGFADIKTNVDVLAVYSSAKDRTSADDDWGDPSNDLAVGFRTDTHISGPFRFLLEYGHNRVWQGGDAPPPNSSLNKLTAAFAASAGADPWSRPTVRVYYTQGWWNEGAGPGTNAVYGNGGFADVYGNDTSGGTLGFQGEVWW